MGTPARKLDPNLDREAWLQRLATLIRDAKAWAEAENWSTHESQKTISERGLGEYVAPVLRLRLPQGEIHVDPIAREILGGDGRVDMLAWPSNNRVKLVVERGDWQIYTDSNIRWPKPWGRDTFIELARELASSV